MARPCCLAGMPVAASSSSPFAAVRVNGRACNVDADGHSPTPQQQLQSTTVVAAACGKLVARGRALVFPAAATASTRAAVLLILPFACGRRHRRWPRKAVTLRRSEATAPATLDLHGRNSRQETGNSQDGAFLVSRASDSVVKVFSAQSSPRTAFPWSYNAQQDGTGSGFCIEVDGRKQLLTNAHVVADSVFIELRRSGEAKRHVATRVRVSHECDLALLDVADPDFWDGLQPLPFGTMPHLQDEVSATGYPVGGDGISMTRGVISRIGIQTYSHSGKWLLAIQIDAAINPGNSGGPALNKEGRVVGVSFQAQTQSQNIGYVIPLPIIEHFLKDADPNDPFQTRGFCSLGITFQGLENAQMRRCLGMNDDQTGIMVTAVAPCSQAACQFCCGDVILSIDGKEIDNDGTFSVAPKERLLFSHLINLKYSGETVEVQLQRDGAQLRLHVPVEPLAMLLPTTQYDVPMPYFLYGGLLFLPLTQPYLKLWGESWEANAPRDLVVLLGLWPETPGEETVILSHVYPCEETQGYAQYAESRVISVNGSKVINLAHMYKLVNQQHATEPYLRIELEKRTGNQIVILDTTTAGEVNAAVMAMQRIPTAASPNLLALEGVVTG